MNIKIKQFKNSSLLVIAMSILLLISCTKKTPKAIYISYQEIEARMDSIQTYSNKTNPELVIDLSDDKGDTIYVSILTDQIEKVRKDNKNLNRFTFFTSLDSLIQILQKNSFDNLPDRGEKNEAKIFFIDVEKKDFIKIIPARQVYQISKDNLNLFN